MKSLACVEKLKTEPEIPFQSWHALSTSNASSTSSQTVPSSIPFPPNGGTLTQSLPTVQRLKLALQTPLSDDGWSDLAHFAACGLHYESLELIFTLCPDKLKPSLLELDHDRDTERTDFLDDLRLNNPGAMVTPPPSPRDENSVSTTPPPAPRKQSSRSWHPEATTFRRCSKFKTSSTAKTSIHTPRTLDTSMPSTTSSNTLVKQHLTGPKAPRACSQPLAMRSIAPAVTCTIVSIISSPTSRRPCGKTSSFISLATFNKEGRAPIQARPCPHSRDEIGGDVSVHRRRQKWLTLCDHERIDFGTGNPNPVGKCRRGCVSKRKQGCSFSFTQLTSENVGCVRD